MFHFYTTPWERKKTKGFLMFSGEIEIEHWAKIGKEIVDLYWTCNKLTNISPVTLSIWKF